MRVNNSNYIKRLKNKKEDALEFIVDKYLPLVKGVTYKVLSSTNRQDIIEECINDIFLSVWNNCDKFSGEEENFKKWICAIAKFKAIDYYRKLNKVSEIAVDNIENEESSSAEDEAILNEDRAQLVNLLNTLDDIDKEIFIMKFFLGVKSEDIASKFGVTKASVDNRIYRGKKKLRERRNSIYENYKDSSSEFNITKESNGISITINDAVFDGVNVVLTYTIESDKDLGDNIGFADRIEIVGNNTTGMVSEYDFIKVNDNTYVGKEKISVLDYVDNPKEEIGLNINIKRIYMIEESEEVKGKWNFNLRLNATEEETKVVNLQSEKDGITAIINRITVNPMSISMKYSQKVSEEVRENYDEVYIELEIRDDLGNVYSNEGNGASGDVNLNMTYGETIEKLKDGASKLIIIPKFILKNFGEVKYVEQESKNGFIGESSISNAETYECVERTELILDDIVIELE